MKNSGGDNTERINKEREGSSPLCWPGLNFCETDGSICLIDVDDCYNECAIANICWVD